MRSLLALCLVLAGCAELQGMLGPANDALDVLCETRPALARVHACGGDVGCKIDVLKAYLNEEGYDPEVAAVLVLLEEQVLKLVREFPGD